ncbi:MAG: serine/threonine-protein kinase, partial [Myxococcota bacterium]|nr:serine/threonine-protein kinase [Myxococcota bacterium]
MENLSENKVFGKYEIINQLAVGGMGQIYLARQHDTYGIDRLVILKSLFPEMARDKECVKMFLDEARIASNLNHPNIVSIYEIGAWEGNYFLAMEYIRGEPLSTLVKRSLDLGEPVPIPFVISMMHDTCAALAYAHKATDIAGAALDLVHRDISPQNIMLSDSGILKVVDFGIARAANRYTQTYAGQIKGKITYMSPEQLRGAELDGRSDQHALGTVMWELVSGQNILNNDMSTTDVLDWKLNNKIPRLSGNREDIPIQIDSILAKMTANEPEKRYQTTQEARDALKELLVAYTDLSSEKLGAWVTHLAGERIAKRHEKIAARTAEFARIGEEKTPEPQEPLTLNPTPLVPLPQAQEHGEPTQRNMSTAVLLGVFLLVTLITTGLLYLGGKPQTSLQAPQNPIVRTSQSHGFLILNTQPSGAQVFLNGKKMGQTPLAQLQVRANHHLNLEFKHEGYATKTLELNIQAD